MHIVNMEIHTAHAYLSGHTHIHTGPVYCPVTSCRFRPFRSETVNGSWTLSSSSPEIQFFGVF